MLFTTHSTVLLDELTPEPFQVFVLEPRSEEVPVRLDQLEDPVWLANFRLGELCADEELGSNTESNS